MTTGGITTGYKWDMGWNVISEVNNVGALMRSYTHNPRGRGRATLAHVDGANPAAGASGADLENFCQTAARICVKEAVARGPNTPPTITHRHFQKALHESCPQSIPSRSVVAS